MSGGMPFCLPTRGWIHGSFFSAAAFTGTACLTHQRNELSTSERENVFLKDIQKSQWKNEAAAQTGTGSRAGRDHLF